MATRILTSSAFAALTIWLGYFAQRDHFWPMLTAYAVFFGLYWVVVFRQRTRTRTDEKWFVGTGIVLRALLLFSLPNLSDDFYRFLWDGHLAAAVVHPFAHPPVYFVENQCLPASVPADFFEKLNSPRYFTVYPPVCQAVFWLAAKLAPGNVGGGVFVLKLFLFACEIATILTIDGERTTTDCSRSSLIPHSPSLIYALNPLAILEIVGNCHFEGAMIFGLVAGLHFLRRKKAGASALCWAFAVASKLLPVLFFPLIIRELGWERALRFGLFFAAASLLLWLPLLDFQVLQNMATSLDLYFQKFEFNASIYYLLREIGYWLKGYNMGYFIGPMLGFCTVGVVLWLAFGRGKFAGASRLDINLDSAMLWSSTIYLFLSSTVHSWYITVPLVLAVRARWRFPVVWSGTAMLSYSHYAGGGFRENYGLIALEYALVLGCLAWEIWTFARANRPTN